MSILHVSLVSVTEGLEKDQHELSRKFDLRELKRLVGEVNNHFDELQQRNPSIGKAVWLHLVRPGCTHVHTC